MGSLLQNTIFGKSKNSFVSTWRTSNTSTGSTSNTQIKLPLVASGTYNFIVDWGDGASNTITIWNQAETTHTYASAGDYTIKINGVCTGWQFNNTGDRLKILSVERWGRNFRLGTNQGSYFYGCANLRLDFVSDVLNLNGTSSLASAFRFCNVLTTINRSNEWNTSSITDISYISQYSPLFNPLISLWNVGNVTTMQGAFFASGFNGDISNWDTSKNTTFYLTFADNTNFNQDIGGWDTGNVLNMQQMFQSAAAFNQPINSWNTSKVTNMASMFQTALAFNQNIGSWNVSKSTNFSSMFQGATYFNNGESSDINNWQINTNASVNMQQMFNKASSFNQPLNNWNTENVTNMNLMFGSTDFFNQNIGAWNVSKVTNFSSMFNTAREFNNGGSPDINNWILNTTANIVMDSMFNTANKFNQNIGNWNVSRVTTFQQMFLNATMFNNGDSSDINNWQLSTTFDINISQMFANAIAFNQNIGSWNVSMVTTFTGMFQGAKAFNNGGSSSINGWPIKTTGSVIMTSMFKDAISFNQPVGLWNVSNVTNMHAMFYGCKNFNQNISTWNTIGVTTMNAMFFNTINFNQPIGSWNVSNVTIMSSMFGVDSLGGGSMQFNQPIGSWDVSNVTNMNGMFDGLSFTSLFNQNIGSWNISNVTNFGNFMRKKTASNFSTTNLDAIYNGWSSRLVQPNINIPFGTAKYTSASSNGRAILTGSPNNWIITDGGI